MTVIGNLIYLFLFWMSYFQLCFVTSFPMQLLLLWSQFLDSDSVLSRRRTISLHYNFLLPTLHPETSLKSHTSLCRHSAQNHPISWNPFHSNHSNAIFSVGTHNTVEWTAWSLRSSLARVKLNNARFQCKHSHRSMRSDLDGLNRSKSPT